VKLPQVFGHQHRDFLVHHFALRVSNTLSAARLTNTILPCSSIVMIASEAVSASAKSVLALSQRAFYLLPLCQFPLQLLVSGDEFRRPPGN
jgi:hypothetical protein